MSRLAFAASLVMCAFWLVPAFAQAQENDGQVRIQGQPFDPNVEELIPEDPFAPGVSLDFREMMRELVQSISTYGRSLNPNFVILTQGSLDLIGKINPEDDTLVFPARTYMRAIDGVLEPKLLSQIQTPPDEDPKKVDPTLLIKRASTIANIKMAQQFGLKVFDLEFATKVAEIDKIYRTSAKHSFVPFVAQSPVLADIPRYPPVPSAFNANPKSVADPAQVQNFLYIANSQGLGLARDFVQTVRNTNHDMIIVDVFHGNEPLTKFDVEVMQYKKLGSRRLVLAQLDLASAASYHFYWKPGWRQGSPAFIGAPYLDDPDSYRTLYWNPAWQALLFGDFNSYLYGIIDLGFDGVVLKGIDAWRYFESGGEQQ